MQLSWTDQQQDTARQFEVIGQRAAARASHCYREGTLDSTAWADLSEAGFWRIPIAEAHGGSGGSWWDFAAALEGLSRGISDLGFLLSVIAHMGCVRILASEGSDEQRETYLRPLLEGSIGSTAITEQGGGSDVAAIQTGGVYATDGTLVLNGQKAHITNAPVAGVVVLLGRIRSLGKRDITLFVFEVPSHGVTTHSAEEMLGNRTSPTGDITLNNVQLPPSSIVGQPGQGLALVYRLIAMDRVLYALVAAAYLEPIFARSLQHSLTRFAYGEQIAQHQYVQQRLVNIRIAIETSRSLAYRALGELIDERPNASMLCSMAKLVGTEQLFQAASDFMMIHGHGGYMVNEISQVLCDSAGTRIAGGTSDIQRKNIFSQLQRLHGHTDSARNDRDELESAALSVTTSSTTSVSGNVTVGSPSMQLDK